MPPIPGMKMSFLISIMKMHFLIESKRFHFQDKLESISPF